MKKIILIFLLCITLFQLSAKGSTKYVIAQLVYSERNNFLYEVNIPFNLGYYKDKDDINIYTFTKDECYSKLLSSNEFFVKDTMTEIDTYMGYAYTYLCVDKEKWDKLEIDISRFKNNKSFNEEYKNIYKNSDKFISAMKPCGLDKIDDMHIPLPTTPLICDKYSEKNPVPVKTYKELISEE